MKDTIKNGALQITLYQSFNNIHYEKCTEWVEKGIFVWSLCFIYIFVLICVIYFFCFSAFLLFFFFFCLIHFSEILCFFTKMCTVDLVSEKKKCRKKVPNVQNRELKQIKEAIYNVKRLLLFKSAKI